MIKAPNEGDRSPMGMDGVFGEATEMAPYVYDVEKMENGATKSFEVYLVSSYPRLAHLNQEINTILGGWGCM